MPAGTACDYSNANDVLCQLWRRHLVRRSGFRRDHGFDRSKKRRSPGAGKLCSLPAGRGAVRQLWQLEPAVAWQIVPPTWAPRTLERLLLPRHQRHAQHRGFTVHAIPDREHIRSLHRHRDQSRSTFTDTSTDPASNNENCYGYQITVTANGGSLTTTPDYYGVLSTADNATSPAFAATPGYDLATGLGSPNVYSLVNAPQWSGGGLTTSVNLSLNNAPHQPGRERHPDGDGDRSRRFAGPGGYGYLLLGQHGSWLRQPTVPGRRGF